MAAFCTCCGAEITLKAEACPVCGTPRHGMLQSDRPLTLVACRGDNVSGHGRCLVAVCSAAMEMNL
jgi:hypothetical protein